MRRGGGRTSFYDDRGDNEIRAGSGTRIDESEYEEPFDPEATTHQAPARDWGSSTIPIPVLEYDPDVGLFAGAGFVRWGYGFRHYPYRTRFQATIGIGTPSGEVRAALDWEFPVGPDALRGRVRGQISGAEVNRFYGLGNETSSEGPRDFFSAERQELVLESLLEWRPAPSFVLAAGPTVRLYRPDSEQETLLAEIDPYGHGDFTEIGVVGELLLDGRDRAVAAGEGGYLQLSGRFFPSGSDVTRGAFGGVRGEGGTYMSAGGPFEPTLAVRVGGEKLWGTVPYHEAAYLGGPGSLRGFRTQRFAGDRSLFANAELRVFLTEVFLLLPSDVGVFGLGDVGRVYFADEVSNAWHGAWGGGVWFSFLRRTNVMSVALARSAEETGVYVKAGFMF